MLDSKQQAKQKKKKSEKGMAILESIPVLFMMIVIFNFALGFFGAIHSGILNSIASYNYTMETFRFRSNLMYFRPGGGLDHYNKAMVRVHGVVADGTKTEDARRSVWPATIRPIALNTAVAKIKVDPNNIDHSYKQRDVAGNVWQAKSDHSPENKDDSPFTPEIWVKTVYGICLNAECEKR